MESYAPGSRADTLPTGECRAGEQALSLECEPLFQGSDVHPNRDHPRLDAEDGEGCQGSWNERGMSLRRPLARREAAPQRPCDCRATGSRPRQVDRAQLGHLIGAD
jgi:hypothetical protein